MHVAYYNEIDSYAAQWLRNLIAADLIAFGIVDERSIEDIKPEELYGFTQCHFFAGVGVWSLALRRAGWPDSRPVWTGSCPCQPFSAAGKGAGFDDERHLWPAFDHLIEECRPAIVFGEQVASKDADPWIDLVQTDLEALGYAFGAVPFPSASVGAPHIRDRLYWAAYANLQRESATRDSAGVEVSWRPSSSCGVGHDDDARLERLARHDSAAGRQRSDRSIASAGVFSRLADNLMQQRSDGQPGVGTINDESGRVEGAAAIAGLCSDLRSGPTNGHWCDADWLFCRDGKWRPVEPGTFPLAHGATSRVGRLRAYGNAINAIQAQVFIETVMESIN